MPYFISPPVRRNQKGLWMEGEAYQVESIIDIKKDDPTKPPVNYEKHILKPHSICHIESPLHILKEGGTVDSYFTPEKSKALWGKALVIKLKGNNFKPTDRAPNHWHWQVTKNELIHAVEKILGSGKMPEKLLLAAEDTPLDEYMQHNQSYVLTLTSDAANWLTSNPKFNMYGTTWKSTDFEPGSRERPIHKIILKQAAIFELLDLTSVPEGEYFFVGSPLRLEGASESPASPMLFKKDEYKLC